jgi:hypothetical protein
LNSELFLEYLLVFDKRIGIGSGSVIEIMDPDLDPGIHIKYGSGGSGLGSQEKITL